ncbi:bifunctional indole-3-glycerol-phosphate synthase TrpC/phosphoribosylanthranilate isomerase TrpF [Colwellia sp. Arc7-635]|uniref:bifunctional indole-3-glycerol-phosphate synthase TrpC/phosphoribosylanthranilate isomerase TrpF n=1 Tax=Colwellia sp. Arc7-635 TaxID=2497879 RepID=UPI000F85AB8B|nr:bifunctional indole-3-glycerol-phosphate synthase TrpC/phosphoribosylanthranilate isomerase TrpF [Colwellia sp. Arc7-635]AZQ83896.1 bifunctional indole-3-glycerol-phosphate synthase TrpC/phosphoribosylanthranilate isomerase TrpF [Colwellia sp. Arc7-635]
MSNILEQIVANRRLEIAQLKETLPLASFIDDLTPSKKDLYKALTRTAEKPYAGFILECKKASPSKGLIREDFNVADIAGIYDNYAAGISVLTEHKYFQGDFSYLKTVSDLVKCPVLNKDFFFDSYQVYLARHYGADAILLMLSVLSDDEYNELAAVAQSLNLAILTEVSNEEERDRAVALNAKLIGINNRNLRDLSTDISRTFDLAPTIPDDRIVISESGIYNNAQVRELAPAVDGFLVGSSVMAEADIDLACRQLIFGHNKVCGLTKPEHASFAIAAGAEFGGLIFADKSPRCVDKAQAKAIVSQNPSLKYVGVFVNHPPAVVLELANELSLFAVQLHGEEPQEYIDNLREELNDNCQIFKALPVELNVPILPKNVDHIVLDGKNAGSGQAFNWQALAESEQDLSRCFLAGGLQLDNITQACAQLTNQELFGLDINSGVESSPGIKCRDKLQQVFAQIRNY